MWSHSFQSDHECSMGFSVFVTGAAVDIACNESNIPVEEVEEQSDYIFTATLVNFVSGHYSTTWFRFICDVGT